MPEIGKLAALGLCCALYTVHASASELSYTFLDFQYLDDTVDAAGLQMQPGDQSVFVDSDTGDGIALAGALRLGGQYFLSGKFVSSIVDVTGTVRNPLTEVTLDDNYDMITSQLAFGRIWPVGLDVDLLLELTYDTMEYDFGSFAGENFDVDESGVGARIGFRWNPNRGPVELYAFSHLSPVGEVSLDRLEFDSDVVHRAGVIWYIFEDMGFGFDYESGQVDRFAVSMRFSFGTLQW